MKVRAAIIGLGGVADRIHLPACHAVPDIDLIAGCDPNTQARETALAKFGLPRAYTTLEEMLDEVRPELVIVGTPPGSHSQICLQAMESGAHVFCEKPFMATVEEADRVIAVARERNLLLRVNNQYRFMTFYAETKKRLERGDFGRPFYIQSWQQMFHPPEKETNWRSQLTRYVIFEFGTHALDLISFFFDALPVSVNAHTPKARPEYDADVLVQMTLRYPEERLAACSFNRITHAPEKYLEMRLDCEDASIRISLGGVARFSIEWSRNAHRFVTRHGFVRGGQAREEVNGNSRTYCSAPKTEFATATAQHLRYFLEEMQKPQRSIESAIHGREMLDLVFAAYDSAASGETVWLDQRRKSDTPQ